MKLGKGSSNLFDSILNSVLEALYRNKMPTNRSFLNCDNPLLLFIFGLSSDFYRSKINEPCHDQHWYHWHCWLSSPPEILVKMKNMNIFVVTSVLVFLPIVTVEPTHCRDFLVIFVSTAAIHLVMTDSSAIKMMLVLDIALLDES